MANKTSGRSGSDGLAGVGEGAGPPAVGETPGRVPRWVVPCPAGSAGGFLAAHDAATLAAFPCLHDFMTVTDLRGKPRRPGSVTFFCEDGKVKAALTDREMGLVAFLTGKTVLTLLESLEKGLETGSLDWRPSKRR